MVTREPNTLAMANFTELLGRHHVPLSLINGLEMNRDMRSKLDGLLFKILLSTYRRMLENNIITPARVRIEETKFLPSEEVLMDILGTLYIPSELQGMNYYDIVNTYDIFMNYDLKPGRGSEFKPTQVCNATILVNSVELQVDKVVLTFKRKNMLFKIVENGHSRLLPDIDIDMTPIFKLGKTYVPRIAADALLFRPSNQGGFGRIKSACLLPYYILERYLEEEDLSPEEVLEDKRIFDRVKLNIESNETARSDLESFIIASFHSAVSTEISRETSPSVIEDKAARVIIGTFNHLATSFQTPVELNYKQLVFHPENIKVIQVTEKFVRVGFSKGIFRDIIGRDIAEEVVGPKYLDIPYREFIKNIICHIDGKIEISDVEEYEKIIIHKRNFTMLKEEDILDLVSKEFLYRKNEVNNFDMVGDLICRVNIGSVYSNGYSGDARVRSIFSKTGIKVNGEDTGYSIETSNYGAAHIDMKTYETVQYGDNESSYTGRDLLVDIDLVKVGAIEPIKEIKVYDITFPLLENVTLKQPEKGLEITTDKVLTKVRCIDIITK